MKILTLIVLYTAISFGTNSQVNNGYYGKKAFLEVDGFGNIPLFSNIFSGAYYAKVASGKVLVDGKDKFNVGYRFSLGYAVKRNVALAFEFGQDFTSVYPNSGIEIDYNYYTVTHERIDVKTTTYIPKIQFTTKKGLLPMGLCHQIGLGFSASSGVEKDYLYRYSDYNTSSPYTNYSDSKTDIDPVDFKKLNKVKKFIILYDLTMRTPINKRLMINYGIRYTFNLGKVNEPLYYSNSNNSNYNFTKSVEKDISRQRSFSFMALHLGLTFVF